MYVVAVFVVLKVVARYVFKMRLQLVGTRERGVHVTGDRLRCWWCHNDAPFELHTYRRWVCVLLVPVFAFGRVRRRHVECGSCGATYHPDALKGADQSGMPTLHTGGLWRCAAHDTDGCVTCPPYVPGAAPAGSALVAAGPYKGRTITIDD